MSTFYHYTCSHGYAAIGRHGTLKPGKAMRPVLAAYWPSRFVWLTDLAEPLTDALGLTSQFISCDRTRHRYRIVDDEAVLPWSAVAAEAGSWRVALEGIPGSAPQHWYLTRTPVTAVYDPLDKKARTR